MIRYENYQKWLDQHGGHDPGIAEADRKPCPSCHHEINRNWNYCAFCGNWISDGGWYMQKDEGYHTHFWDAARIRDLFLEFLTLQTDGEHDDALVRHLWDWIKHVPFSMVHPAGDEEGRPHPEK